jgi:hypothetical protein
MRSTDEMVTATDPDQLAALVTAARQNRPARGTRS